MKLYKLLPSIIRTRDRLASEASGNEPVLERLMAAMEDFMGEVIGDIDNLPSLLSDFDPQPALYISLMLGSLLDTTQNVTFRKWFVENLVYAHKIKGTKLSWNRTWRLLGENEVTIQMNPHQPGVAASIEPAQSGVAPPLFIDVRCRRFGGDGLEMIRDFGKLAQA